MEPVSVKTLQHGKKPTPTPPINRLMSKLGIAALVGSLAMAGNSPQQEITSQPLSAHSSEPHIKHAWEEVISGRKMVFYSYRYRLFYYGYAKTGHWGMGQRYADVGKWNLATYLGFWGKLYQKKQDWELPQHLENWQRENIPHAFEGTGIVTNIETAHVELARTFQDPSCVLVGFAHSKHETDGEGPAHDHDHNVRTNVKPASPMREVNENPLNLFTLLDAHAAPKHADEPTAQEHALANTMHHHWYDGGDMTWIGWWSAVHHSHHSNEVHAGHEYHAGNAHDPWGHIGSLGIGHGHNPFWWLSHFTLNHNSVHHEETHVSIGHAHHAHHHWYDGGDTTWLGWWSAVHHPPHAHEIDDEHDHHTGGAHNPWAYLGHILDGSDHDPLRWHGIFGFAHAHHPRVVEEHLAHVIAEIHEHVRHDEQETNAHFETSHAEESARPRQASTKQGISIELHAEHNSGNHEEVLHTHFAASKLEMNSFHLPHVPISVIIGAKQIEAPYARVASASASPESPKS